MVIHSTERTLTVYYSVCPVGTTIIYSSSQNYPIKSIHIVKVHNNSHLKALYIIRSRTYSITESTWQQRRGRLPFNRKSPPSEAGSGRVSHLPQTSLGGGWGGRQNDKGTRFGVSSICPVMITTGLLFIVDDKVWYRSPLKSVAAVFSCHPPLNTR